MAEVENIAEHAEDCESIPEDDNGSVAESLRFLLFEKIEWSMEVDNVLSH